MYHCTIDLLFDLFGLVRFENKNNSCQLSDSWFQTSQTGGQLYSDTSPFSITWSGWLCVSVALRRLNNYLRILKKFSTLQFFSEGNLSQSESEESEEEVEYEDEIVRFWNNFLDYYLDLSNFHQFITVNRYEIYVGKSFCKTCKNIGDGVIACVNVIKLYGRKIRLFIKARVFVPGKPFQPSLMFVGEARNLP